MDYTMNKFITLNDAKEIVGVLYPDCSKEFLDRTANTLARKFKVNDIEVAMLHKLLYGTAPEVPDCISTSLQSEVTEDLKTAIRKFIGNEYTSYKCSRPYTSSVCSCADADESDFFYSLGGLSAEDIACLLADTAWSDSLQLIVANTRFSSVTEFLKDIQIYKGYVMVIPERCEWKYADSANAHNYIDSIARMMASPMGKAAIDATKLGILIGCDVTGTFEKHDISDRFAAELEGLGLKLTTTEAAIINCMFWANTVSDFKSNGDKINSMLCDMGYMQLAYVFWNTYEGIIDKIVDIASSVSRKKKHSEYTDSSLFNNEYAKRIEEMVSTKVADCLWLSDAAKEGCDNFDITTIRELLGTEFNIVLSFMSIEDLCYLNGMQRSAVSNGCSLFVVD